MKTISVDISETGEVKIEATGFKGKGCKEATAAIEKAIGVVKATQTKPEFSQAISITQGA